ncbi:MAG: family 20 glycosylhydrolase [Clostridia bacterium]|nr:family 20 glycosylhydrolase [Clostridia bacterium]
MSFSTCPRVKRTRAKEGIFRFSELRIFTVGDGKRLFRALRVFHPDLVLRESPREEANVILSVASVFSSKEEFCSVRIGENCIQIRCRDQNGARNAAAILAQILRFDDEGYFIPCGDLEDWPDASYRGMMLESSGRSWIPMERIYRYIREMALARMNVLQFHFMEDSGCTVMLDSYPDLWGYGEKNLRYTKDEIRAMIAYADELGIRVTPFVEVLSHTVDFAIKAGITCEGDREENMFAVCVGSEHTYAAIEKILFEVAELFPDEVMHIGADEYDMSGVSPRTAYWEHCPRCQALSKRLGYATMRELFVYAVERVNMIVNRLGKVMMLWNADLKPGELPEDLERNMIVHYYRSDNILGKEKHFDLWPDGYVEDGFAVLNSYYPETYMDLPAYMSAEKLCGWSYLTRPAVSGGNRHGIIGGCCCAWSEAEHYERTISPAIFLFADRLWNAESDPVPYDSAYGRTLTRILFEGKLPVEMNVFDIFGMLLPPTHQTALVHARYLSALLETLCQIRAALKALAEEGDTLAEAYLSAADAAIKIREEQLQKKGPLDHRIKFEG